MAEAMVKPRAGEMSVKVFVMVVEIIRDSSLEIPAAKLGEMTEITAAVRAGTTSDRP